MLPQRPAPACSGERLRVVHPLLPICFAVLSFGLAGFLVPSRQELAQRLFKDGSHVRAMQATLDIDTSGEISAADVDWQQAEDALTRLLMDPSTITESVQSPGKLDVLAQGILTARDPSAALVNVADLAAVLPTRDREGLLRAVAARALDQGQPALAGLVFNQLVQLRPETMSEEMLREVVRSWRANSHPAEALDGIQVWMASAASRGLQPSPIVQEERIQLLLETDHAPQALELLLAQLESQQTGSGVIRATLERAIEAAGYCGKITEMRPHVTSFLTAQTLGLATVAEIGADLASSQPKLMAQRESWMRMATDLAHWCEWSDAADEALGLYEKLAVLGDAGALQRVAEIGPDLGSTGRMLVVLDLVMGRSENAIYARSYGLQLGLAGRLEESSSQYTRWLKSHPQDSEALAEYAALCEERDDLEAALVAWKQVANLQPDNPEFRKREAEVCLDLKRDREALDLYRSLAPSQHDSTSLENFALVAEALGEYPALNQALLWRFQRLDHPHTPDYLELARSYSLIGQFAEQLDLLRKAVVSIPQSFTLRRQLASTLQDVDRNLEALEVLEVPGTREDLRSMCLYITAASRSDQFMRAASFLKLAIATRQDFPADVRLDLGHICYHTGQFDEARKFFGSVDSNAATWPLLAQACYQLGSFTEAEKYQRKYLEEMDAVPAEQYIFLGDICRGAGHEEEADRAYDLALETIRNKHEEETPPSPAPKISARGFP